VSETALARSKAGDREPLYSRDLLPLELDEF